jgi:hypothetical protein
MNIPQKGSHHARDIVRLRLEANALIKELTSQLIHRLFGTSKICIFQVVQEGFKIKQCSYTFIKGTLSGIESLNKG